MPSLEVECGRFRRLDNGAYIAAALAGGAIWFGVNGLVFMAVIAATLWPAQRIRIEWSEQGIDRLRLTQWHAAWRQGLRVQHLYRDEVSPEEFARVRRSLKRSVGA